MIFIHIAEYGAYCQRSLMSRAFLSGSSVKVEHLLTIQLPLHWRNFQRFIGFSLCVVTEFEETLAAGRDYFRVKCRSNFETKTLCESETKYLEGFCNLTVAMTIGLKIWRLTRNHIFLGFDPCLRVRFLEVNSIQLPRLSSPFIILIKHFNLPGQISCDASIISKWSEENIHREQINLP